MTHVVRRARGEKGIEFDGLYERNVGRIYALSLRMTADPEWAEELTQDIFARAWKQLSSFRGESRVSTWLHRLAVNVVIDAKRRRGRERHHLGRLRGVHHPVAVADTGTWKLDLEKAVSRLPERPRMALVLYAIEGYKYREIADVMDISVGAVKAHIHHARRCLLEEIDT